MKELINKLREAAKESLFYKDLFNEAADYIRKLIDERNTLRNEMCLHCGKYKHSYLAACDGCKWKE